MLEEKEILITPQEALDIANYNTMFDLSFFLNIEDAARYEQIQNKTCNKRFSEIRALSAAFMAGYVQAIREQRRGKGAPPIIRRGARYSPRTGWKTWGGMRGNTFEIMDDRRKNHGKESGEYTAAA